MQDYLVEQDHHGLRRCSTAYPGPHRSVHFRRYHRVRWFMVQHKVLGLLQTVIGTLPRITRRRTLFSTWPVYDNGFWNMGGFGAMQDVESRNATKPAERHTRDLRESEYADHMLGMCLT